MLCYIVAIQLDYWSYRGFIPNHIKKMVGSESKSVIFFCNKSNHESRHWLHFSSLSKEASLFVVLLPLARMSVVGLYGE